MGWTGMAPNSMHKRNRGVDRICEMLAFSIVPALAVEDFPRYQYGQRRQSKMIHGKCMFPFYPMLFIGLFAYISLKQLFLSVI